MIGFKINHRDQSGSKPLMILITPNIYQWFLCSRWFILTITKDGKGGKNEKGSIN